MSGVWFFGLGALGIHLPFFSFFLADGDSLRPAEIGLVLAIVPLMGIIGQPFWGQVADRSGFRTRVVAGLAVGFGCGYLAIGFAPSFPALLLATAFAAFFWTSLIPNTMAVTLAIAQSGSPHSFGRIRVFGTLGFGFFVVVFPWLLDAYQDYARLLEPDISNFKLDEPGLEIMFPVTAGIALLCAACALALPHSGSVAVRAEAGDWRELFRNPRYLRLLSYVMVANVFLHGPLSMFPNLVKTQGGDVAVVSRMWILMLVLEVPLVAMTGTTLAKLGARGLLAVSVAAGGVRWLVCATAQDLDWLYASSVLHGVVVAGLIIGAPLYAEAIVPERLRSTGQGLLSMLGTGVGALISALMTGLLFDLAGPQSPYLVGGFGALGLAALLPIWLPSLAPKAQPRESS